jgi:hypothetical protein
MNQKVDRDVPGTTAHRRMTRITLGLAGQAKKKTQKKKNKKKLSALSKSPFLGVRLFSPSDHD